MRLHSTRQRLLPDGLVRLRLRYELPRVRTQLRGQHLAGNLRDGVHSLPGPHSEWQRDLHGGHVRYHL